MAHWTALAGSPHSEFNKPTEKRDWHRATIEFRSLQRLIYEMVDMLTEITRDNIKYGDLDRALGTATVQQLRDWMEAARRATR